MLSNRILHNIRAREYNVSRLAFSQTKQRKLKKENSMSNAMMIIFPYREQYTWVFDDDRVGLVRELFV